MCSCGQGSFEPFLYLTMVALVWAAWRVATGTPGSGKDGEACRMTFTRVALSALLVFMALAVWGCGQATAPANKADAPDKVGIAEQKVAAPGNEAAKSTVSEAKGSTDAVEKSSVKRPKLLDLGATKCIPCKKMAPILEEMKIEFKGRLDVEFIDVWVNPKAGQLYGIESIPTQIFYSADGKELFRHEGFFSREEILSKWKELGVDLGVEPGK